jgi:hypothetical protein
MSLSQCCRAIVWIIDEPNGRCGYCGRIDRYRDETGKEILVKPGATYPTDETTYPNPTQPRELPLPTTIEAEYGLLNLADGVSEDLRELQRLDLEATIFAAVLHQNFLAIPFDTDDTATVSLPSHSSEYASYVQMVLTLAQTLRESGFLTE